MNGKLRNRFCEVGATAVLMTMVMEAVHGGGLERGMVGIRPLPERQRLVWDGVGSRMAMQAHSLPLQWRLNKSVSDPN